MDKFKVFYNEKNGKMILFFGFYLIFFIFLFIYLQNYKNSKPVENQENNNNQVVEKISTYDISNLVNNNYYYTISILDNDATRNFNGTKNNVDYENYEYKYFLDIYNINQLLKRSKFIDSNENILSYELSNQELNDILLTKKGDGINTIAVHVNNKGEVEKITLDLSNYLEKDNYRISISYTIGEKNENSIS